MRDGFCPPDLCEGYQCPFLADCFSRDEKRECSCRESCEGENFDPVCSSLGVTYSNMCELRKDACAKKNAEIKLNNKGFCNEKFASG